MVLERNSYLLLPKKQRGPEKERRRHMAQSTNNVSHRARLLLPPVCCVSYMCRPCVVWRESSPLVCVVLLWRYLALANAARRLTTKKQCHQRQPEHVHSS